MPKNYALFQDALADVRSSATGVDDDEVARTFRTAALAGMAHTLAFASNVSEDRLDAAHDALSRLYAQEPMPAEAAQLAPADLPASVADLLRLTPDLSPEDLHRIRREFALTHHPDRAPASQLEQATRRMAEANILIDEALARARSCARPRSVSD